MLNKLLLQLIIYSPKWLEMARYVMRHEFHSCQRGRKADCVMKPGALACGAMKQFAFLQGGCTTT